MYTTEHKLNLANSIIADFCGDVTALGRKYQDIKAIQKMERNYIKSKGFDCDVSDFCIRLSDIPHIHYRLMVTINWIDDITASPVKGQNGFYKSVFSDEQGIARVEYFITLDKYVGLLFIELNIKNIYQNVA